MAALQQSLYSLVSDSPAVHRRLKRITVWTTNQMWREAFYTFLNGFQRKKIGTRQTRVCVCGPVVRLRTTVLWKCRPIQDSRWRWKEFVYLCHINWSLHIHRVPAKINNTRMANVKMWSVLTEPLHWLKKDICKRENKFTKKRQKFGRSIDFCFRRGRWEQQLEDESN